MISTKSQAKLLADLKNSIEDAQHGKDLRGERDAFLSTEKSSQIRGFDADRRRRGSFYGAPSNQLGHPVFSLALLSAATATLRINILR